jgi:hypothetical protein
MSLPRIKILPEKLKKNGFEYRLIKRISNRAIYSQHEGLGQIVAFEVFKIKTGKPHPKAIDDLENYDVVERFPLDEDFGKTAWTYPSIELAQARFEGA